MDDTHQFMYRFAPLLVLAVACASSRGSVARTTPIVTSGSTGELVVEARRVGDSAIVPIIRAGLQPDSAMSNTQTLARVELGRAVFAAVPPGRYLLRNSAIGYVGRRDSVVIHANSIDTVRVYLSVTRCDLDCPDVYVPRRSWWKFWPVARTI